MGVYLGRGDVRVSEHHLDASEVRSPFQQMGGKTVPHDVRSQPAEYPHPLSMHSQELPEGLPRKPAAPSRYKKVTTSSASQQ
jgi:hypothetical protein